MAVGGSEPRLHKHFITEKSMLSNFEKVFGHKCDILAKIMYVFLSKGKECSYISFAQFGQAFMPLVVSSRTLAS